MIGKETVLERDVTLSEAKHILSKKRKEEELSYEQKQTYEYVKDFGKIAPTKARELVEELKKIPKIDEATAVLIVNNMPTDKDDLRVIMEKKRYDLEDSEVKKILDLLAEYSK